MKLQTPLVWAVGALLIALSYHRFGWMGVALVVTGIVFWMMLHFTRMMTVLRRAGNAPMGYVASAVMLNAKLKTGVTAMTKSLGALQTDKDAQPEVYRWTDTGGSHVTCTFVGGKLAEYVLWRPEVAS
jgi:CDP-diglyceride synthetase